MKICIILFFIITNIACAVTQYSVPGLIKTNELVYPERVAQVMLQVKDRLPNLDLTRIEVVVKTNTRKLYCEGITDACTYHIRNKGKPSFSIVHVPWDRNSEPQQLLAHELCHVYYFQTRNDADGKHAYRECFDDVVKRL